MQQIKTNRGGTKITVYVNFDEVRPVEKPEDAYFFKTFEYDQDGKFIGEEWGYGPKYPGSDEVAKLQFENNIKLLKKIGKQFKDKKR